MKPKNVVAQELRTTKYKPRVIVSKVKYTRKQKFGKDSKEGIGKESLRYPYQSPLCFRNFNENGVSSVQY